VPHFDECNEELPRQGGASVGTTSIPNGQEHSIQPAGLVSGVSTSIQINMIWLNGPGDVFQYYQTINGSKPIHLGSLDIFILLGRGLVDRNMLGSTPDVLYIDGTLRCARSARIFNIRGQGKISESSLT
jgi:hypothetical protein